MVAVLGMSTELPGIFCPVYCLAGPVFRWSDVYPAPADYLITPKERSIRDYPQCNGLVNRTNDLQYLYVLYQI